MRNIFFLIIPFFLLGCEFSDKENSKEILDIKLQAQENSKNISQNLDNLDKSLENLKKNSENLEHEIDFESLLNESIEDTTPIVEYGNSEDLNFDNFKTGSKVLATVDGLDFDLEVAQTQAEHEKGLMNREKIREDGGMLFIFKKTDKYAFWMKNTLIPLDILWIDEDKKIVDFTVMQPCTTPKCPQYKPAGKAKYVIELPAGNFSGEIGDFVSF